MSFNCRFKSRMTFRSARLDAFASSAAATADSDSSITRSLALMMPFRVSFSFFSPSTSFRYCEMRSCSRTTSDLSSDDDNDPPLAWSNEFSRSASAEVFSSSAASSRFSSFSFFISEFISL